MSTSDREVLQSLERALMVIRSLSDGGAPRTLTEIAAQNDLSRATARRIVLTLHKVGYVTTDGKRFALSPRVLEIGQGYLSSLQLPEIAHPDMLELVAQTRESSSLATLDGHDIVYVARVPTKRIMTISLAVGTRLPAYATSMGRVLLAALGPGALAEYLATVKLERLTPKTVPSTTKLAEALDQVRRQGGWALVDEELEVGVRSVSTPIVNRAGKAVAALNVSGHASRVSCEQMTHDFLPLIQNTAQRISALLPD